MTEKELIAVHDAHVIRDALRYYARHTGDRRIDETLGRLSPVPAMTDLLEARR